MPGLSPTSGLSANGVTYTYDASGNITGLAGSNGAVIAQGAMPKQSRKASVLSYFRSADLRGLGDAHHARQLALHAKGQLVG